MPLLLLTNHVNKGFTNNEHSMITMIGKTKIVPSLEKATIQRKGHVVLQKLSSQIIESSGLQH